MTDRNADIAADIQARLNTAVLALRAAAEITPQRNPFREVETAIVNALIHAISARVRCQKVGS